MFFFWVDYGNDGRFGSHVNGLRSVGVNYSNDDTRHIGGGCARLLGRSLGRIR